MVNLKHKGVAAGWSMCRLIREFVTMVVRVSFRGRDRRRSEERGRSVSRERGRGRDKRDASPQLSSHSTDGDEEEGDNKYRKNVSVPPLLLVDFSVACRCTDSAMCGWGGGRQ